MACKPALAGHSSDCCTGRVQIPWRSLQPTIVRSCGSGSYADVFEVYFRQAPMAMKVLHLQSNGTTGVSEETLKHFKCAPPFFRRPHGAWVLLCLQLLGSLDRGSSGCCVLLLNYRLPQPKWGAMPACSHRASRVVMSRVGPGSTRSAAALASGPVCPCC